MFVNPSYDIVGHAGIERARPVRHNINIVLIVCRHRLLIIVLSTAAGKRDTSSSRRAGSGTQYDRGDVSMRRKGVSPSHSSEGVP